jgi:protein-tyrosine phosphatase
MIDIHHHLLFGLDDGSPDVETSLAMIDMAIADGITHIVCTPHSNHRYLFQPEVNDEQSAVLRERAKGQITLGLGCDFHLSYDNLEDAMKHPPKYSINHKQFLLVEFADALIPTSINEAFYELGIAGLRPIITHPERNSVIKQNPERLLEWLQAGCTVQITAGSLTGRFGKTAQKLCHQFLEKNWVHFVATDAHNLETRPPRMREAFDIIAEGYGQETAERLCVQNPLAVFNGQNLLPQPEAAGLYEDFTKPAKRKSGFFERLFSR